LQQAIRCHGLELLRFQQSVDQISEQKYGRNAANDVVHKESQAIARFGERPAEHEEQQSDQHIKEVKHDSKLAFAG
jgi:hypothetical protein